MEIVVYSSNVWVYICISHGSLSDGRDVNTDQTFGFDNFIHSIRQQWQLTSVDTGNALSVRGIKGYRRNSLVWAAYIFFENTQTKLSSSHGTSGIHPFCSVEICEIFVIPLFSRNCNWLNRISTINRKHVLCCISLINASNVIVKNASSNLVPA